MLEFRTNHEAEKKFIATTYIDLMRHGSRFGGPMEIIFYDGNKIKFDDSTDLTPEGKAKSQKFGENAFPEEVTLVHPRGGDEPRHGETGEDLLFGSKKFGKRETPAPVLKEGMIKGIRRGKGVDYASSGIGPHLKKYKDLITCELNRIISSLSPDEQDRLKTDAELRAKYREKAQISGLKEALKNEQLVEIAAQNEAYELMHVIKLSRRGIKGGETKAISIVGSGLFAESLLKKVIVIEDLKTGEKKEGFNDIEEIGGFTKQAAAIRLKMIRDERLGNAKKLEDFSKDTQIEIEFTDPERVELFKGKKVSLSWGKVQELAEKAERGFKK